MPTTVVKRNEGLINAMSTDYVKLFSVSTSYGNAVSMFLGLPGLIGYWPMNISDSNDDIYDLSEHELLLVHSP